MKLSPHHTAVTVSNMDRSLAFYTALGFSQVHRFDEEDGSMTIVHLKLEDYFLELFSFNYAIKSTKSFGYANDIEEIGVKHVALKTDDIEKALSELKQVGLADDSVSIEKSNTNKAWWFFIKDPDGMWVEIIKDDRY